MSQPPITCRPYVHPADFEKVYRFLTDTYAKNGSTGQRAPFFEYALTQETFDRLHMERNAVWEAGEETVAFCYYEMEPTRAYCNFKPGYTFLAEAAVAWAERMMREEGKPASFGTFDTQAALRETLTQKGYRATVRFPYRMLDLRKPLAYALPEGFSFVAMKDADLLKLSRMVARGFNREDWREQSDTGERRKRRSPHQTVDLSVLIRDAGGAYACFAGMWYIPANRLAYLEPLFTVPEYRRMGLASAALSELKRRTVPLGATDMTGGSDTFYTGLGYEVAANEEIWEKK